MLKRSNKILPPQWALRFFRWYCNKDYLEDLEGDLLERFETRVRSDGNAKAKRSFIKDVVQLFRPGIIRPLMNKNMFNPNSMLKTNIKIATRHLIKDKGYSIINIGGLAMGMTVAILIGLWIWDEVSSINIIITMTRLPRSCKTKILVEIFRHGIVRPDSLARRFVTVMEAISSMYQWRPSRGGIPCLWKIRR